jgi:formate dehydrogenase (coenzyme F420) beta subunit
MTELQELAKKLLTDKTVAVVVGYEQGPRGARPAFVTDPDDTGRLIFDERCVQNLAAYLNPRRNHLKPLGKPAVVVKGCDLRAVGGLIRETQLKRDEVVLIGVRCGGVLADPTAKGPLTADNVADRCPGCDAREPAANRVDHLLGENRAAPPGEKKREKRVAELLAMPIEQRFAYWKSELERCIRCHACREVCPLCFCERCAANKTDPQWIDSSPHARGNFAWQMTRVLHLAGRCVDCGECERVCPAGIPITLIGRRVAAVVEERFGYRPTDDPEVPAPVGTYQKDDAEEFIR